MKTVETKTARTHKLAITVDLTEERQIVEAINLLVEKLGRVPVVLNEEQKCLWNLKIEKPYHFCFIKAYCTVTGFGISHGKRAVEEAEFFSELNLDPTITGRFWKVFHEKLEERL